MADGFTGLGPRTDRLLSHAIERAMKDDVKNLITNKLLDPLSAYVYQTVKPYMITAIIGYIILLVLLVYVIYLLHKRLPEIRPVPITQSIGLGQSRS